MEEDTSQRSHRSPVGRAWCTCTDDSPSLVDTASAFGTSILLFLAGAGLGAVMCALIYRRLATAQAAQATSEVAGKAAASEAGLKAQLEAAERRTADTAQQLDAARTTIGLRDQELRLAQADITRHKTE